MHDAFAIIRWRDTGISPAVSSPLWSESVGAEVLVFVVLGPWLLSLLGRSGALASRRNVADLSDAQIVAEIQAAAGEEICLAA